MFYADFSALLSVVSFFPVSHMFIQSYSISLKFLPITDLPKWSHLAKLSMSCSTDCLFWIISYIDCTINDRSIYFSFSSVVSILLIYRSHPARYAIYVSIPSDSFRLKHFSFPTYVLLNSVAHTLRVYVNPNNYLYPSVFFSCLPLNRLISNVVVLNK